MKEMILDKIESLIKTVDFILNSEEFMIPEKNRQNLEALLDSLITTYNNGLDAYDKDTLIEYNAYLDRVANDLNLNYGVVQNEEEFEFAEQLADADEIEEDIEEDIEEEDVQRATVVEPESEEEREETVKKASGCRKALMAVGIGLGVFLAALGVKGCVDKELASTRAAYEHDIDELEEELKSVKQEAEAKAKKEAQDKAKQEAENKAEKEAEETKKVLTIDQVDFHNMDSIRKYAEYIKHTSNTDLTVEEITNVLIITNIDKFEDRDYVIETNGESKFDTVEEIYEIYEDTAKLADVASDRLVTSDSHGYFISKNDLEKLLAKHGASDQIDKFDGAKTQDGRYILTAVIDVLRYNTKLHNADSEVHAKVYNEAFSVFAVDQSQAVDDGLALYLGSVYSADLADTAAETVGYWNSIIYGMYYDENGNFIDMDGKGGWICSEELMGNHTMYETIPYADHTIDINSSVFNTRGFEYQMAEALASMQRVK